MAPQELPLPGTRPTEKEITVDTMKDTAPRPVPEVAAGDPFIAAGRECFTCYDGKVFIGRLDVNPETGEEVEVIETVPCRRCEGRA